MSIKDTKKKNSAINKKPIVTAVDSLGITAIEINASGIQSMVKNINIEQI